MNVFVCVYYYIYIYICFCCVFVCVYVCMYVYMYGYMYDYIYVLFVCRVWLYIYRHNALAQGIKSFLASQVWFQAVAGARTYGTG